MAILRMAETFLVFVKVFMQFCVLWTSFSTTHKSPKTTNLQKKNPPIPKQTQHHTHCPPPPKKTGGMGCGILHTSHRFLFYFFFFVGNSRFLLEPQAILVWLLQATWSKKCCGLPEMQTSLFRWCLALFLCPLFRPFLERHLWRVTKHVWFCSACTSFPCCSANKNGCVRISSKYMLNSTFCVLRLMATHTHIYGFQKCICGWRWGA